MVNATFIYDTVITGELVVANTFFHLIAIYQIKGIGTLHNCISDVTATHKNTKMPIDYSGFIWNQTGVIVMEQCYYTGVFDVGGNTGNKDFPGCGSALIVYANLTNNLLIQDCEINGTLKMLNYTKQLLGVAIVILYAHSNTKIVLANIKYSGTVENIQKTNASMKVSFVVGTVVNNGDVRCSNLPAENAKVKHVNSGNLVIS